MRYVPYRLQLLGFALKGRCRNETDWWLRWWQRYWLTVKCCAAVLLGVERWHAYTFEDVTVAHFDFQRTTHFEFGEGANWTELRCPKRGFGFTIQSNGYP